MLQLWGLKAGKLKQMHRCGQMARLVAQRSQSPPPPSANVLGLSLLPRLWGWVRPLHISSKADV